MHGSDEPVALPWDRPDKCGVGGGVAQDLTQPHHRSVKAVVEFDKCAGFPEAIPQIVASYQSSRMLQQDSQQTQGLVLQFEAQSLLTQFITIQIDLKQAKTDNLRGRLNGS